MGWTVTLLVVATVVLAVAVLTLSERVKELRSEFERRLKVIEELRDPFAAKLPGILPPPLGRILCLKVHLDEVFWRNTLQCSPAELEEVRRHVYLHDDLARHGAEELFEFFEADIHVDIQEWRGHTRIEVDRYGPSATAPRWFDSHKHGPLWDLDFPVSEGHITGGLLRLEFDGDYVRLSITGGRFGYRSFMETDPSPENIFLNLPLHEKSLAEYYKPEYREFHPDVEGGFDVPPWLRCYQSVDQKKGIGWRLLISDRELCWRSGDREDVADKLLASGEHPTNEAVAQAAAARRVQFLREIEEASLEES